MTGPNIGISSDHPLSSSSGCLVSGVAKYNVVMPLITVGNCCISDIFSVFAPLLNVIAVFDHKHGVSMFSCGLDSLHPSIGGILSLLFTANSVLVFLILIVFIIGSDNTSILLSFELISTSISQTSILS
jgi:hypothetical protein